MPDSLHILDFEFLLCPMEQHTQISLLHIELAADFVTVPFLKKDRLEQRAVARSQALQYLAYLLLHLFGGHHVVRGCSRGNRLRGSFRIQGFAAARGAVFLKEHVIASGVDKRAEPLRVAQASIPAKDRKDPRECFLAHVLDCVRRLELGSKLESKQFGKVAEEMFLSFALPGAKALYIFRIERVELQCTLREERRRRV
jgi:hypothetical protein